MTQTHFELFDLPVSFDIDQQQLAQRYREMQKAVHPDRFAGASDHERRISVEKAARINDAFQVLKSPQRRARYMLELLGVSFDDEKDTAVDPAFLMEQIELREALGELGNSSEALHELTRIMQDINRRIDSVMKEVADYFQREELNDDEKNSIKSLIHKMQFLNKLQQEAEFQEEKLLDQL